MGRLNEFFFACLLLSADIVISLITIFVLIWSIRPALGLLALATVIPTIVLIALFASKLQPQWRKVHDLHSEMTTTDNALTRPWTVTKNYRRTQNVAWGEGNCAEGNQHITIGKEVYFWPDIPVVQSALAAVQEYLEMQR